MRDLNAGIAGLFTGGAYSLLAISVTLLYRTTGVLSFSHAAFAAVGAYVYVDGVVDQGWPKPVAALVAVAVTTLYGLVIERVAIRPLAGAPVVTRLIATLGVLSFTSGILLARYGFSPLTAPELLPHDTLTVGDVVVTYQQVALLVVAAAVAAGLAALLYRTNFGAALRAAAEDGEAASLSGVSPSTVARFNWASGAALAGAAGVLVAPLQFVTAGTFALVLAKALSAALLGGLASLGLAFAGGLIIGVIESVAVVRFATPGAPELGVLALVVGVLALRRSWPAEPKAAPPAPRTRRLRLQWRLPTIPGAGVPLAIIGIGVAVIIPANSNYWAFIGGRAVFFAIEALSLVILTGWAGQVSLMHGAYVGIGAFGTAYLVNEQGMSLGAALILSALLGTGLGALAGIPALRLSGLQFAVASLVFSGAASAWLFKWSSLPRSLPRGSLFGIDLLDDKNVYFVMLGAAGILFVVTLNLRRSTFSSLLLAARESPATVDHFGVSSARVRMGAFLWASFIATLGGGFYAVLVSGLSAGDFSLLLSISLLIYAVVGGSRSLLGPVIAAVAFGVLPQVFQVRAGSSASAVPDIVAGGLVIALLILRPAGIASVLSQALPAATAPTAAPSSAPSSRRPDPKQIARVVSYVRHRPLVRR